LAQSGSSPPVVFQYNKGDLPNAANRRDLSAALNEHNLPEFEAIALHGRGVRETFEALLERMRRGDDLRGPVPRWALRGRRTARGVVVSLLNNLGLILNRNYF